MKTGSPHSPCRPEFYYILGRLDFVLLIKNNDLSFTWLDLIEM